MQSLNGDWINYMHLWATCLPLPQHTAMINYDHLQNDPLNYDSLSFERDAFATFNK